MLQGAWGGIGTARALSLGDGREWKGGGGVCCRDTAPAPSLEAEPGRGVPVLPAVAAAGTVLWGGSPAQDGPAGWWLGHTPPHTPTHPGGPGWESACGDCGGSWCCWGGCPMEGEQWGGRAVGREGCPGDGGMRGLIPGDGGRDAPRAGRRERCLGRGGGGARGAAAAARCFGAPCWSALRTAVGGGGAGLPAVP